MSWIKNRWLDALVKYAIIFAIYHIVFIVVGIVTGSSPSILGNNYLWSHWSNVTWFNYLSAIIASIGIYFFIYFTLTDKKQNSF